MDSLALTLVHPSSKTCSTSRVMTQGIHHSLRRVVAIPHACCHIWGALGMASRPPHVTIFRIAAHDSESVIDHDHLFPIQSTRSFSSRMGLALPFRPFCCWRLADGPITGRGGALEFCTLNANGDVTVGPYRPNITIFFTLLAVGVSFAWLGVDDPSQWRAGVALYILGCGSRDFLSLLFSHLNACTCCSSDLVSGKGNHMVVSSTQLLIRRCLGCSYILDCGVPWPGSQSPRSSRVCLGGETRIQAVSTPVWIHLPSLTDWSR